MRASAFDDSHVSSSSSPISTPSNSSPLIQASVSFVSFFNSYCCVSLASCFRASPKEDYYPQEKSLPSVEYSQPALTPFPALQTVPETHVREVGLGAYTIRKPRTRRKSSETMRSILAAWRKQHRRPSKSGSSNTAGSSVRRLKISGPTNFRHVSTQSFLYPTMTVPLAPEPVDVVEVVDLSESREGSDSERPSSFHPLELSIHESTKKMSPILPLFYWPELPASVRLSGHHTGVVLDSSDDANFRAMSFHVPRRPIVNPMPINPVLDSLGEDGDDDNMVPPIPPKSRKRAYTTPESKEMVERIASALIEKEKIEQAIEDCIERESIYINSRPSTAMSNFEMKGLEPMPCVPALPPLAPSFSQRVRPSLQRPATAPSSSSSSSPSFVASASPIDSPITPVTESYTVTPNSPIVHMPLTPPLPLVLRPPLRKKQAFKRVSSWLFPDEQFANLVNQGTQQQQLSIAVTNSPLPVTDRDGFYQCMTPPAHRSTSATIGSRRRRLPSSEDDDDDSSSEFSEWASEDDTTLQNTSTWSPASALGMQRVGPFHSKHSASNASSSAPIRAELAYPVVGVAF